MFGSLQRATTAARPNLEKRFNDALSIMNSRPHLEIYCKFKFKNENYEKVDEEVFREDERVFLN